MLAQIGKKLDFEKYRKFSSLEILYLTMINRQYVITQEVYPSPFLSISFY